MFEVWIRNHHAVRNGIVKVYTTASVIDTSSKTNRLQANAFISDAKSSLKSKSDEVISRIGSNGAVAKLMALIQNGWSLNVGQNDFIKIAEFPTSDSAEKHRDDYIDSYHGPNIMLGKPGFRRKDKNGNAVKAHTFSQKISRNSATALARLENLIDSFGMVVDRSLLANAKFTNGQPMRSLSFIIMYGSVHERIKGHNPSNVCTINGVNFEEGEFTNYGQILQKLILSHIVQ